MTALLLKTYSPAIRYGIAVAVSLLSFIVSEILFPDFLSPVFFLPVVAVMMSALLGGWGPGLLATVLSGISFVYFFLPLTIDPLDHFWRELTRLGVFLLFSLAITVISATLRSTNRAAHAARLEAEEANRYKTRLISTVSHDLRTPLNAIIGYSELLLSGTYGAVLEEQILPLEGVRRNAGDLLKMVNDILDLARIESGRESVLVAPVELPFLINGILSEVKPLADQKGLSITCHLPETLPRIESDEMKIKQILINLLSNAIKFTDQGEIKVAAQDRSDEKGIEIKVQDTGAGIPPDAIPKLFEAFYQVERADKPKGSGLGLAIVKDIVHLLKGKIEVESEQGTGSTFTVFLPYRFYS